MFHKYYEYFKNYFTLCNVISWQNAIFLDDSEKVIQSWKGDCESFFQTVCVLIEVSCRKIAFLCTSKSRRKRGLLRLRWHCGKNEKHYTPL